MASEGITVERLEVYTEADAAQLGRLGPFLSERFSGEPMDADILRGIINSPYHDQLVARLEGVIVGSATMNLLMGFSRKGWLEDFVVDGSIRKKGIGGKIWDEMLSWCDERGVDLDFTSKPTRRDAHAFYLDHGAVIKETTVFHVPLQ